jgi:hypothetical protein
MNYTVRTDTKNGEPVDRLFPQPATILDRIRSHPDILVGVKQVSKDTATLYVTGPAELVRELAGQVVF